MRKLLLRSALGALCLGVVACSASELTEAQTDVQLAESFAPILSAVPGVTASEVALFGQLTSGASTLLANAASSVSMNVSTEAAVISGLQTAIGLVRADLPTNAKVDADLTTASAVLTQLQAESTQTLQTQAIVDIAILATDYAAAHGVATASTSSSVMRLGPAGSKA